MQIGAYGWDHDSWQGYFYPDDLPGDWRLGYYAGEFSSVVVPVADWTGLTPERVVQWCEDTRAGFRFYLELPTGDSTWTEPARVLATISLLGERLGGFVADLENEAGHRADLDHRWAEIAPVCLIAGQAYADERVDVCSTDDGHCRGPGRLAVWRCTEKHIEPAAIRARLELLAAAGVGEALLWCGREPETPEVMHQARVLADLMGI